MQVFACDTCEVRCTVYTFRRLRGTPRRLHAKLVKTFEKSLLFFPLWRRPPCGSPSPSKTKPVNTMNSIAIGFPLWTLTSWLAGKNWPLDHLLSLVTDRSDGVREIRSFFHRALLSLCVRIKRASNYFIPLQLVPRCDVRVVLTRDLVKKSASIFVPSGGLLRFSVRVVLLERLED